MEVSDKEWERILFSEGTVEEYESQKHRSEFCILTNIDSCSQYIDQVFFILVGSLTFADLELAWVCAHADHTVCPTER
jgi:hypothetical protein